MAGTTIWKGSIRFGETSVAVKLHAAVREERIRFHLLHQSDGVRLHQQMICALEQTPVPPEEQIKGYEVEAGKYLLVDPEELEQTTPERSRTIEVHEFVPRARIDPLFRARTYYLEADILATGYRELAEVLEELDVAGLCTWTMRKRAYFGAVQAWGGLLRLATLRYADEVVATSALGLQELPLAEKELRIGRELIQQLTAPFAPQKFINEHEQKLHQLIEKKARGEKLVLLKPRQLSPTAPDQLLETLVASLKKVA